MILEKFKKMDNEHNYIYFFSTTYVLSKELTRAVVTALNADMDEFYLYEFSNENKDKSELKNISELTYNAPIPVAGKNVLPR